MSTLNAPTNVSFALGQSVPQHFKAFTNYMTQQTKMHANKVFARYYSNGEYKTATYADIDRLATNLACKWAKDAQGTEVVSFISDHSINYMIVMLAIMKLRITMLAISPRNSEAADVNLLEKTQSKLLIANVKYESIAKAAVSQVSGVKLIVIPPLDIEALLKEPINPDYQQILNLDFSDEDILKPALIIHSSGSTAFPKPIYLSNRYLFNVMSCFEVLVNSKDHLESMTEKDVALPSVPLFHIFGFFVHFSVTAFGGSCVFLEKLPPSQTEITKALVANNVTIMAAPPLILEQMIPYLEETKDLAPVQRLKYLIFGGANLKHETGEWFHAHGVNVRDMYGTTEIGAIMTSDLDRNSKNWGSLRLFHRDPQGHPYGTFEINDQSEPSVKHLYIHADSPTLANHVANRADGGYDTQDLFIENPNYPGYYTYLGRRDDTLIMENGEKTNPVPMEATIRQSPMIEQVAVLGQGRQCTAALIQLNRDFAERFGPEEIIATVHAAVKEANLECPGHSKILPQMVKILPFNKVLPSTDKGTVMRKKTESTYQDVVEKLYKDFLEGPTSRTKTNAGDDTSAWTPEQTEDFLIACAAEVLDVPQSTFKDRTQSVFDFGLNSLSAIQLRNRIAEYFDMVPQNFLFQHPSIVSMREALMSDQQEDASEQVEKQYQRTQQLAESYIKMAKKDFPRARNFYNENKSKVILLTGVTGSLGSFMLRDLLQDPTVDKVYCCIRGKDSQLRDRLVEAFESRSLDTSLLNTDRVEVLPMRFSEPFLGLTEERYYQLKQEVTIVQHCAWLLNFNMPVDHFDKECIQPFYKLLKFAYKEVNPMHVHFISSISASAAAGAEILEEPLPLDPKVSMPMGYAASKFVVEALFNYLTTEKEFPCYIERLGQVCGDSENGVWNVSEQYPLMFVGGGSIMHKMPNLDTVIDWITVDYAAASIADIMLKTANLPADPEKSIYHIVNPKLVMWSDILTAMKKNGMEFDIVEPAEWVEELAKDDTNPAFRLMSFYEGNFKENFKMPVWKTDKTSAMTPIIAKSPVLDADLFGKFLTRWQSVGFYNPAN
ncbi:hypothetical protein V8B55DRAFT_1592110 [Mucor lusitanicus]|uniref:Carrier domain-containing protein n=2 Tax=Mucor circinelloides f. lusitanicus TaxID=29924 RepID=A0A168JX19_MUCCL|nr:hypothetical protein FB192DRAFT_1315781 [Mucor lusitanicus]OAD01718.1 hypothetical protein MUCCIDRAFT_82114 [Mucor lusitanicus CBS 277.49]